MEEIFQYDIIDEMFHKGYVPKIYNRCYGGFEWSNEARKLIKKCKTELLPVFEDLSIQTEFIDAKILTYLEKNGINPSGDCSKLDFEFVRIEYFDFIDVHEYDGMERLNFNFDRYFHKISLEILNDESISNSEKIEKIRSIKKNKPVLLRKDVILENEQGTQVVLLI